MKYARIEKDGIIYQGFLEGESLVLVKGSFGALLQTGERVPLEGARFLAPVLPSKVVAVGLNYQDHILEMKHERPGSPTLFLKPSTAVIGPGEWIIRPQMAGQVDYEAELAIVIGKRCEKVAVEDAREFVFGYTCLNDVTARDLQALDGQWTRAKGFDTFCPIGPVITDEIDPDHAKICSRLNGEVRQASNTTYFLWKTNQLISFISHVMTLLPGDVITTGTPSGIGPMEAGDRIEIEIQGIGILENRVK